MLFVLIISDAEMAPTVSVPALSMVPLPVTLAKEPFFSVVNLPVLVLTNFEVASILKPASEVMVPVFTSVASDANLVKPETLRIELFVAVTSAPGIVLSV